MADFKTIADTITLFPHPNADGLLLGKVGPFQVVVGKSNNYQDGQIVIFAPERAILPDDLKGQYVNTETGISYLHGPEKNRVGRIRLRGEYSDGATLSPEWVCTKLGLISPDQIPLGEDLSEKLGITKYEPPLPVGFGGEIERMENVPGGWNHHDVEQSRIYQREFAEGEEVYAFEKIHGSQVVIKRTKDGVFYVSSKGMSKGYFAIKEDEKNIYWQGVRNTNLFGLINNTFAVGETEHGDTVNTLEFFGEVFPCQGGNWTYGATKPTIRLFRIVVNGKDWAYDGIVTHLPEIAELWVPKLYQGPFDMTVLSELAKGKEQVSGKELHIKEGVVVSPVEPRLASEGFNLMVKIINPRFKEDDPEAFS